MRCSADHTYVCVESFVDRQNACSVSKSEACKEFVFLDNFSIMGNNRNADNNNNRICVLPCSVLEHPLPFPIRGDNDSY